MGFVFGFLFGIVLLFVLLLVVVGLVSALAWMLRAVLVALAVGVLGGLGLSALATGSADPASPLALLGGAAIFVLTLAIGGRRERRLAARHRRRTATIEVAATRAPPPAPAPAPAAAPAPAPTPAGANAAAIADPDLAAAWGRMAAAADFARSRIAVVAASCTRFLAAADARADHGDAADFAVLIRRRVPEHVDECLAQCRLATPAEARALLDEAVADLERLGARADKRRAALLAAHGGPGERRSLLARRLDDDPFA